MADVFISYKRERRPVARHLEQILTRYGYTVWFDLALVRGTDYEDQIQRQLNAAKAVIVLWCGLSVQSGGVRAEASRAKAQGKLVPIVIEPCELPLFSTNDQNIDLTAATGSPRDHALDPVLDDIERLVGQPPVADLKGLRDYEATWRTMGALPLARFPLEQVAVSDTLARPGSAAGAAAPQGATLLAVAAQEWPTVRDSRDPARLGRFAQHFPGTWFADEALRLRAEVEAEQRAREERSAKAKAAAERLDVYRKDDRIKIEAKIIHGAPVETGGGWFKPGAGKTEWFKDLDVGPEMIVVPAGSFTMGSNDYDSEKPPHKVAIPAPLAVGRFAVTFDEWDAAVAAGGVTHEPGDQGWGRGRRPVINVSWEDAKTYCAWLSMATGKSYRLLSEAEWEYCCRAGTTTKYAFGDAFSNAHANNDKGRTVDVGQYSANSWGLFDMHGNVWEWCEDNWHGDYKGAPTDGSVWQGGDASSRVLRGGSWDINPQDLRSADRGRNRPDNRNDDIGFRVARTLLPL